MYQKYIILDTNILVSWLIQLKIPTLTMIRSLAQTYKFAISEIGYKELYRTAYKIYVKDDVSVPGEWEEVFERIEKAVHSGLFCFFTPINVIQLKDDPRAEKYYHLRKQDYNDLFFLDLAVFTSADYFITRDCKLLKSIGASEVNSVQFYQTTIIHQTHMMNVLGL
jgi:predicted nucleic acid-binding protein